MSSSDDIRPSVTTIILLRRLRSRLRAGGNFQGSFRPGLQKSFALPAIPISDRQTTTCAALVNMQAFDAELSPLRPVNMLPSGPTTDRSSFWDRSGSRWLVWKCHFYRVYWINHSRAGSSFHLSQRSQWEVEWIGGRASCGAKAEKCAGCIYWSADAEIKKVKAERNSLLTVIFEQNLANESHKSASKRMILKVASIFNTSLWPVRCWVLPLHVSVVKLQSCVFFIPPRGYSVLAGGRLFPATVWLSRLALWFPRALWFYWKV